MTTSRSQAGIFFCAITFRPDLAPSQPYSSWVLAATLHKYWMNTQAHEFSGLRCRVTDGTVRLGYKTPHVPYHRNPKLGNLLSPRSRTILEKLPVPQLVKQLPTHYGTRRFITVFTKAGHLSLSSANLIHSTSYPTYLWFISSSHNATAQCS
jgi:hypothetical protein